MDKDGNEVMEYHRRLKGIPAPVITHAAEQYDCSIWELYEKMATAIGKENAVQFDLTCGQKRLSLSFYGGRVSYSSAICFVISLTHPLGPMFTVFSTITQFWSYTMGKCRGWSNGLGYLY